MTSKNKTCLYCQTPNETEQIKCRHCGMPLTKFQQNKADKNSRIFIKVFWAIVIFCVVMMIYLPR